jgi:hypothetical protein
MPGVLPTPLLTSDGGVSVGFRSSSSLAGASAANAAVPVPTGAAVGDIAVVGIYMESAATVTPPSGFTLKSSLQTSVASRGRLDVFWKRLTAADTGTYTFTFTSTFRAAACGLFSGRIASGDPFDGTVGTAESATTVTTLNVSTTPTGSNGDAVGFWTNFNGGAGFTAPTNYTEQVDLSVLTMDTRDAVASGSTGNVTATASITDFMKAFLGVLAVASGSSNWTQSPADVVGLTDTVQVDTPGSLSSADTESISDSTATDRGLAKPDSLGITDSVIVAGPARYITSIAGSGNQQYPVDQSGNPILVKGDVIWAFPANAGRWNGGDWQGDITSYLDIRQGQGFNLLMIGALGSTQNGGPSDTGATWDSVSPWASGVKGNLNTTYWDRVDYIIDQAAARGITCLMNVAYSYDMDTAALNGATNTQYTNYGTNLGNRYKTKPNLIWGVGGDYFDTQQTQIGNLFTAVAATGDTHLRSVQNYPESTSRKDISNNGTQNTGVSWSSWNFVYSYNVTYDGVEYAYDETSPIMAIWGDGHFDQNSSGDRVVMRNDIWWAFSSGARGHIYGSEGTWNWQTGSLSNASTETVPSTDLAGYWSILTGLSNWWKLVPDTDSSFVTAGRGTHAAALTSGGGGGGYDSADPQDQYVTASVAPDGSLAVVYSPVAHTITVNPAEMSGTYTVRKVDPASGASSSVTISSTYAISGTNSRGGSDWLLVFESAGSTNWTQTPTDAVGVSDGPVFAAGKALSDPIGVTDQPAFAVGTAAAESVGVTDTTTFSLGRAQTDAVGVTDSVLLEKVLAVAPTDSVNVTESQLYDQGKAVSEPVGLTDAATVQKSGAGAINQTDAEDITDIAAFAIGSSLTDLLGVTDTASVQKSGAGTIDQTDPAGVTDTAALAVTLGRTDSVGVTDSVVVTPGHEVTRADSIGISDAVTLVVTRDLGDTLTVTDTADLVAAFVRVLTDNAALTDTAVVLKTGPNTGTTTRPFTGTTPQPGTGRTIRPYAGRTVRPG